MHFIEALEKWEKHFLGRNKTKRDKTTFAGYFSHGENKTESSFLSDFDQFKDYEVNDPNLEDYLHKAISTAVKGNSHSKQNAIVMAKSFVDFLNKECGGKINIAYPRVNVSNSLERQMEIVRLLQEEGMTVDELENRLWVDVRTIESDLARLSGASGDPIEVLGQRLNVEFDRSKGRISFPSKVHPFITPLIWPVHSLWLSRCEIRPSVSVFLDSPICSRRGWMRQPAASFWDRSETRKLGMKPWNCSFKREYANSC